MDPQLLNYYEAIERASADMLAAARAGNWDEVVKLEGACVLLISQLKHAAQDSGACGERWTRPRWTPPRPSRASCSASWSTTPRSATWPNPGCRTSKRPWPATPHLH
jgi:hypothetical protein